MDALNLYLVRNKIELQDSPKLTLFFTLESANSNFLPKKLKFYDKMRLCK